MAILYPPLQREGRYPTLGQNRQFKFTNTTESFPPPIVPASAATILHHDGHDVFWADGIIKRMEIETFNKEVRDFAPDLVLLETKTPLIYEHWKYIDHLKRDLDAVVVMVGDHVSWNPHESLLCSKADFVGTSGDYDYLLQSICNHVDKGARLAPGIWFRDGHKIRNTGPPKLVENLDTLPYIDWDLIGSGYHEAYLYRPTGYLMTGRGCGGGCEGVGCCTFCIWQHALWKLKSRLRSPAHVAEEISQMVDRFSFKEIFDDNESGAIYSKKWLNEFLKEMEDRGLIGEVVLSTNSRADNLDDETCTLLSKLGFRLLKVGLESGSNDTLARIEKRETIEQIEAGVKNAKNHGLRVKLTTMTGFPWESESDVRKTYHVTKKLMLYKTRFGDCLQSSVVVPYPGSPLYFQSLKNGWFSEDPQNYEAYDMSKPILQCSYDPMAWCEKIWKIHRKLRFVLSSFFSLRSVADAKLAIIGLRSLQGHEEDQTWGQNVPWLEEQ